MRHTRELEPQSQSDKLQTRLKIAAHVAGPVVASGTAAFINNDPEVVSKLMRMGEYGLGAFVGQWYADKVAGKRQEELKSWFNRLCLSVQYQANMILAAVTTRKLLEAVVVNQYDWATLTLGPLTLATQAADQLYGWKVASDAKEADSIKRFEARFKVALLAAGFAGALSYVYLNRGEYGLSGLVGVSALANIEKALLTCPEYEDYILTHIKGVILRKAPLKTSQEALRLTAQPGTEFWTQAFKEIVDGGLSTYSQVEDTLYKLTTKYSKWENYRTEVKNLLLFTKLLRAGPSCTVKYLLQGRVEEALQIFMGKVPPSQALPEKHPNQINIPNEVILAPDPLLPQIETSLPPVEALEKFVPNLPEAVKVQIDSLVDASIKFEDVATEAKEALYVEVAKDLSKLSEIENATLWDAGLLNGETTRILAGMLSLLNYREIRNLVSTMSGISVNDEIVRQRAEAFILARQSLNSTSITDVKFLQDISGLLNPLPKNEPIQLPLM